MSFLRRILKLLKVGPQMKTKGVKDNLLFANACKKKVGGSKKAKGPSMAETDSLLNICQRANFSCVSCKRGGEVKNEVGWDE